MIPADNVVMGVPKKGRLYDRCMKLLAGAGMDHRRVGVCVLFNFSIDRANWLTNDNTSSLSAVDNKNMLLKAMIWGPEMGRHGVDYSPG